MADSNSFTSHFIELRSRLLNSLIFIFVVFVILKATMGLRVSEAEELEGLSLSEHGDLPYAGKIKRE